jgi:RND family efflux transporter MFP subunit
LPLHRYGAAGHKGEDMHKSWWIGGLAALLAAGAGVALTTGALKLPGLSDDDKKAKTEVPLAFAPREVVQPQLVRLPAIVEFSGPLVAPETAIVRAKAAGTLLALNAPEGSRVAAGQVLGRIDLAELTSRIAERGAQVESARTALAQAERTHGSNERLAAQQFISPIALDNSRAAVETARAQLAAAQASLDATRTSLRDGTLVAPIAGIVAKRHVLPGEKVTNEQQVLTIIDLSRLELAGSVGTHEVSRLAPGLPVSVQVEGQDAPVAGRIARIAPAAEAGTRSIGVTIELDNPQERLRAGQYALARAVLADDTDRLTLPVTAIGNTAGQDHVWVIESGLLARRAVTLGRRDEREARVEVLQGVAAGSQVLAARFDNLREGAKASVVAEKSAPVASAAASTPLVR